MAPDDGADAARPTDSDNTLGGACALRDLDRLLRSFTARLRVAGVPSPRVDAELIAAAVLGESRGRLLARAIAGSMVDSGQAQRMEGLVAQRARRVPLQHLLGTAPFLDMDLQVGPGVFVPRPETEELVRLAVDVLAGGQPRGDGCGDDVMAASTAGARPTVVDVGTGSGAVAIGIARAVPRARVFAVERDARAAAWARRNIAAYASQVRLILGDFREAAELGLPQCDLVVSNPPYVPTNQALPPEVAHHDPAAALFSGEDGLDDIRALASVAPGLLRPGGVLAFEHGDDQGPASRAILTDAGWCDPRTGQDLTGRDRFTWARRPDESSTDTGPSR